MAVISGISWTAAEGGPEGHYIWAGELPGLYPYRSDAIPMPTLSGSIVVPAEGSYYVSVTGYKTVDGDRVYGPFLDEQLLETSGDNPVGQAVLGAR